MAPNINSAYKNVYWCACTGSDDSDSALRGDSDHMEHETLFTASKWEILKQLERGPQSPLQLSRACKTSIANVSQQLRLLEMAGLVASERISNRDKGKPRVLYSLAGNLSYLIATGRFVDKKLLRLSAYNSIIMRIWFHPQRELHYTIEKAFWKLEEHLDSLGRIAIDTREGVVFHIEGHRSLPGPITITDPAGTSRRVRFTAEAAGKDAYLLHDPKDEEREQ